MNVRSTKSGARGGRGTPHVPGVGDIASSVLAITTSRDFSKMIQSKRPNCCSLTRVTTDPFSWKRSASAKTSQLEAAVADLLRHSNLQDLSHYRPSQTPSSSYSRQVQSVGLPTEGVTMAMTRENSQDPDTEPELISAPMGSLFEVTKLRNLRSNLPMQLPLASGVEDDVISRGLLPLEEAEKLFEFFSRRMNHFLWGGISLVHSDLASTRRSSSLLSTAILVVAALHIPGRNDIFDTCYATFVSTLSSTTFRRYHSLDDIRGLAIGAFWLSDLSWMLSGLAVRIATEMDLHHSLRKLLRGKLDQFDGAQLWYLLYVCDHHFSIAYNRPAVIHDSEGIANFAEYLQNPSAGPGDVRLIAQVALFQSLTNAYYMFGTDVEQPLREADFRFLRHFNIEIETWRMEWEPQSGMHHTVIGLNDWLLTNYIADNPYVGTYPSKGVVLHYYFAKFHLNSLSLRAIASDANLSIDRREAANTAISSAMATLNMVLHEPDIRQALVGVPLFTHTMVAFSAVFLLKVAWKWGSAPLNIDHHQVLGLVQDVIDVLSNVKASEKHLTYHIANGLKKMLAKFRSREVGASSNFDFAMKAMDVVEKACLTSESALQSVEGFGVDFPETWNEFPVSLDFFPVSFPQLPHE